VGQKTFVIVGSRGEDGSGYGSGVVEIWTSGPKTRTLLLEKESCIPIVNLVGLETLVASADQLFLALASAGTSGSLYSGAVYIYR
jgi:hypothetical protein